MSGVIPVSFKTVDLASLDDDVVDQIVRVHFPERVKVISVSFCVTDSLLANAASQYWYLQGTKYRRPRPDPGSDWNLRYGASCNIWPGGDPVISGAPRLWTNNLSDSSPLSTIVALPETGTWDLEPSAGTFVADVAQMDPDEWLEFYLDGYPSRPNSWPGSATITVAYEGATNLD